MSRESDYQATVIKMIDRRLPGCFVIKQSTDFVQGLPDLLVLYGDRWAMLEVKISSRSRFRPNQEYYLDLFHRMSFAALIHPENEEAVLDELCQTLQFGPGASRFS